MYRTRTIDSTMNQLRYSYSYTLVQLYYGSGTRVHVLCTAHDDSQHIPYMYVQVRLVLYEYKYRTAVSTVFSMCLLLYELDQVRIDAFPRRYLAFRRSHYSSTELQYRLHIHLHTFRSETTSKCQKYRKIGHNAKALPA